MGFIVLCLQGVRRGHGFEGVNVLQFRDFDKVGQLKELLEADQAVMLVVVHIDDSEDFSRDTAVSLLVVIVVKNIGQERLCLEMLKSTVMVDVVLLEHNSDVLASLLLALKSDLLEAFLVLVEDVGHQQVC